MTLTVGAAIDYLTTQATLAVVGVTVEGQPIEVVDGWPRELTNGMFLIGLSHPPPDAVLSDITIDRTWEGVGGFRVEDNFEIPCCIDIRVGGIAQKAARDIAEAVFNAFWVLVKADLTLGGALQSPRVAEIDTITSTPSNVGTVTVPARRQTISFAVRCRNRTI